MFLSRNKKINVHPCKPQFYYIKVEFKGSKFYRHVFVMFGKELKCPSSWGKFGVHIYLRREDDQMHYINARNWFKICIQIRQAKGNKLDPNQKPRIAASDQSLHCLPLTSLRHINI